MRRLDEEVEESIRRAGMRIYQIIYIVREVDDKKEGGLLKVREAFAIHNIPDKNYRTHTHTRSP